MVFGNMAVPGFVFLVDENGLKSLVPFMLLGCSKTQSIQALGQLVVYFYIVKLRVTGEWN